MRALTYVAPARSAVSRFWESQSYFRFGYAWTSAVERDPWLATVIPCETGRDLT